MKALHVITSLGRECGGPVRSVQGLAAALGEVGVETWLLSMTTESKPWLEGKYRYRCANANGYFGYVSAMRKMLEEVSPDIVHLHNIWNPDIHAAAVVCRSCDVPYISAPRGSLEPWCLRQKWLKKKVAMLIYQRYDLAHAAALHATCLEESEHLKQLGFKNHIIVSPNGVNLPTGLPERQRDVQKGRRLLFLSRIHRKKGLVEFTRAWGMVRPKGWKFEIAGFDEDGSLTQVLSVARQGGFEDDIIATGPLDDDAKWNAYARADAFVLPTYSENFGIVVAEALFAGLPVITTTGAPWGELKEHRCGWWVNCDTDSLAVALQELVETPQNDLAEMGQRGHELVLARYSWPAIARQMAEEYKRICMQK